MGTVEHTPGPWDLVVDGMEAVVVDSDGHEIAVVTVDAEEQNANARLIVVAPEMVDLLEDILHHLAGLPLRRQVCDLLHKVKGVTA